MRSTHHVTRQELLTAELPTARRFTEGQSARAFRGKEQRGWITAMPAAGAAFERVAFVHAHHALVGLVGHVRDGKEWFQEEDLSAELGGIWSAFWVLPQLAKIGLAVVDYGEDEVRLRPADPRAARFVNESRNNVGPRGYKIERLIEAFLPVRAPRCRDVRVTDDRRIALADVLDTSWEIGADDLFSERRRVRLASRWTVLKVIDLELETA